MSLLSQQPRRKRRAMQRASFRLRAGPLVGIRDSLDPAVSSDPTRAVAIENMRPLEVDKASVFVKVPGFGQAGSQLGAANKRTGQLVTQFTKLDGTEYTVAIVGGQGIYTYDWSTEAWTQVVTVANLTSASVTLSETARCYAVTFNDKLIISDGTNKPFSWDGTSGAGGLVSLTAASVWFGQPTVYYAKLFAIQNANRNVIEWSEEIDETIGYAQAAYNNIWQLGQTDQEALVAIVGTNERLYYFRAYSTGAVSGAVTPTFATDGTREGVDETIGTLSPAGVTYRDRRLFFPDPRARPYAVTPGGPLAPLWADINELLASVDKSITSMAKAIACYDQRTQLVLLGMVEIGQTNPSLIIALNPVLDVPVAVWRGYTFMTLGIVKNADGVPTLMHLSDDGYAYAHGLPEGDVWDHGLNAGTTAMRCVVETCHLGADSRTEKKYLRADLILRADADTTEITASYFTPRGDSAGQTGEVEGHLSRWDEEDWDDFAWASDTVEAKTSFGLNGTGRWARWRTAHEVLGEQFGFAYADIEAMETDDAPQAP